MKVKNGFHFNFTTLFLPLSLLIALHLTRTSVTAQYPLGIRDNWGLDISQNMRVKLSSLHPSQLLQNRNPHSQGLPFPVGVQQNIPSNINAIEQYSRERSSNSPQPTESNPNGDKRKSQLENNVLPPNGQRDDVPNSVQFLQPPPNLPVPVNNFKDSSSGSAAFSNVGVNSLRKEVQTQPNSDAGIFKVPLPPGIPKSYNTKQTVLRRYNVPNVPRFPGSVSSIPPPPVDFQIPISKTSEPVHPSQRPVDFQIPISKTSEPVYPPQRPVDFQIPISKTSEPVYPPQRPVDLQIPISKTPEPVYYPPQRPVDFQIPISKTSGPAHPPQQLPSPPNRVPGTHVGPLIPENNQIKPVSPILSPETDHGDIPQISPNSNFQYKPMPPYNSQNENNVPLPPFRTIQNKHAGTTFKSIMRPGGFPGYIIDMGDGSSRSIYNSNIPRIMGPTGELPPQHSRGLIPPPELPLHSMQNIQNVQLHSPLLPVISHGFRGQVPAPIQGYSGLSGQASKLSDEQSSSSALNGQSHRNRMNIRPPASYSQVQFGDSFYKNKPRRPRPGVSKQVTAPRGSLLDSTAQMTNLQQNSGRTTPFVTTLQSSKQVTAPRGSFLDSTAQMTNLQQNSGRTTPFVPTLQSSKQVTAPGGSLLDSTAQMTNLQQNSGRTTPFVLTLQSSKQVTAPGGSLLDSTAQMTNLQQNSGRTTPFVASLQSSQAPNTMALNTILSSPLLSAMNIQHPGTPVRTLPAISNMNTITSLNKELNDQHRFTFPEHSLDYRDRRYFPADQQNQAQQVAHGSVAAVIPLQRNVPQAQQQRSFYTPQGSSQFAPILQNQQIPVSSASQSQYLEEHTIRDPASRRTPHPFFQVNQNQQQNPSPRGRFIRPNERAEGYIPTRRILQNGPPYRYIQSGQIQNTNRFTVPGQFLQTLANSFPNQPSGRASPYVERGGPYSETQSRYQSLQYPGIKDQREFQQLQQQRQTDLKIRENIQQEQRRKFAIQARIQQTHAQRLQAGGQVEQMQTQGPHMGRQFQQISTPPPQSHDQFQQIPTSRFQSSSEPYQRVQIQGNQAFQPFQQIQAPKLQAGGLFQQLQSFPSRREQQFPFGRIPGPYTFTGKILPDTPNTGAQPQIMQQQNYGVGNSPVTPFTLPEATGFQGSGFRPYAYDGQSGSNKGNNYRRPTPYAIPEYKKPVEESPGNPSPFSGDYTNVKTVGNPILQSLQPPPRYPSPQQPQLPNNNGGGNSRTNPSIDTTSSGSNGGTKPPLQGDTNDNRGSNNTSNNYDAQPRPDARSHEIPASSLPNVRTVQKLEHSQSATQTPSPVLPRHRGEMPFYSQSQVDSHHRRLLEHKETKEDSEFESDPTILQWYLRRAKQVLHKKSDNNTQAHVPNEQGGNDALSANGHSFGSENVVSAGTGTGLSNANPQLPPLHGTTNANSNSAFGINEPGVSTLTKTSAATASAPNPPNGIAQSPDPVSTDVLQQHTINNNLAVPTTDKPAQINLKKRSTSFEDLYDFLLDSDLFD